MNKRFNTILLLLLCTSTLDAEIQLTAAQQKSINLNIVKAVLQESRQRLQFNGILTADQQRTHRVAPVVDGIITKLLVVSHQRVSKGQILARLRSHSLGQAQAEYLEALARFNLVKGEHKRILSLYNDGVVAESRWRKVESEYQTFQATFETRRRLLLLAGLSENQIQRLAKQPNRLAEFNLVSPIDGMVTAVDAETGQLITAGQAAFHIDDLSVLWAMVKIPVASLSQIESGVDAVIRVQADPSQSYHGKLESLGVEVDSQSQTLSGRIVLDNPAGILRPGMYAEVTLDTLSRKGLMVPATSVFFVGDQTYVFKILGQGRFEPVTIVIGTEADGWIPVHKGLTVGEKVVSTGVAELKSHWQYQGGE